MPLFYINLFFTLPLCAKTSSVVLLMLSQTMKEKIELHFENLKESNSYYKDVFSRQVDKFQVGTWIHNCLYLVQHTPIHLVEAKCKAESLGHWRNFMKPKLRKKRAMINGGMMILIN